MRYKRVKLSGVFLTMLFTDGKFPGAMIKNGFPEGTRFAYAIPDTDYGIWLVVEHDSFPALKDGDIIPIIEPPLCELIHDDEDIYIKALREFHLKFNHYTSSVPHIPPDNVLELRRKLVSEEAKEFDDATQEIMDDMIDDVGGVVNVADALADTLYVVFGTALAYGIDIRKVFMEVHRSNMTKSMEKDEKHIKGKTIKGPNYDPPNIRQFIDTPNFGAE